MSKIQGIEMPQVTPLGALRASFTDKCGRLLAGGKIYTYEENSLTPKITYADFTGVVPNTNPIVLDRSGEADIFLDGSYRFQIFDRFGTLIHDINNVRYHFKDQIKSYFIENILAVGGLPENSVADYNYLMQRLAQITVNKGWDASFVTTASGQNQQQINDFGGAKWYAKVGGYELGAAVKLDNGGTVKSTITDNTNDPNVSMSGWVKVGNGLDCESIAEMLTIQNPVNGMRVYVKSYHVGLGRGGGTFIYNASKSTINDGVVTFNGWVRASFMYLTLSMGGGIGDGVTPEWSDLNKVIRYGFENNLTVDGEGLTYLAAALFVDSNLYLKNAYFKNSVLGQNMISVFTTDESTANWLENVTFENVHIDGRRALSTGLPSGTFDEDGGRHGFRFVKKCRNIRFIDSGADNCCVDGVIMYAKQSVGNEVWQSFVQDVSFEGTCHFHNNGRWGISADSVDGMTFGDGMKASGNGLSLEQGAGITTGLSARLQEGKEYGGAVDIEEYKGKSYSKNIVFGVVDFTKNAAQSVNFTRTGTLSLPTYNVTFNDGGLYDNGISTNKSPSSDYAIVFGGYSMVNQQYSYRAISIGSIDTGGAKIYLSGVANSNIDRLTHTSAVELSLSVVNASEGVNFTLLDSYSNYLIQDVYRDKSSVWMGKSVSKNDAMLHNASTVGSESGYMIWEDGAAQSGWKFRKVAAGYECDYYSGATPRLTIRQYGSIIPITDNIVQIGEAGKRLSNIYLVNAPTVGSDIRYKENIQDLTDIEKLVSAELKPLIKTYSLIGGDSKKHVGIIAQDVVAVFEKYGLNVHDYNLIHYGQDVDRYSIRYEELIMFILATM